MIRTTVNSIPLPLILLSILSGILFDSFHDRFNGLYPVLLHADLDQHRGCLDGLERGQGRLLRLVAVPPAQLMRQPSAQSAALFRMGRLLPSPEPFLQSASAFKAEKIPARRARSRRSGIFVRVLNIDA